MEKLVRLGTAILEEIEIEISIRISIKREEITILGIENIDFNKLLEGIELKTLPENLRQRALEAKNFTGEELISLIKAYIERALLHIKKANIIIENLNEK